jgi:hypothetical protein
MPEDGSPSAVGRADAAPGSEMKQIALSFLRHGTIAFGGLPRTLQ